jgi:FkbM family methyltransferase
VGQLALSLNKNIKAIVRVKEFSFIFRLISFYLILALSWFHQETFSYVIDSLYGKWVEKRFGVKFVDYRGFPGDVFWGDYFQREDFLPSKGWTVVDVGATCGDWSIIAGKFFGVDKVLAIEPSPIPFSSLLKNIRLNNLTNVIIPIKACLWSSDTQIYLHSSPSLFLSVQGSGSALRVKARKLDSLIEETGLKDLNLLKIDTEGSELRVLRGAISTIRRFRPKMIIEVHSSELREKVIGFLLSEGYQVVHERVNSNYPLVSILYFLYSNNESHIPHRL